MQLEGTDLLKSYYGPIDPRWSILMRSINFASRQISLLGRMCEIMSNRKESQ